MRITLEKIGKQFKEEWVFQNITYEFASGRSYAVLGSNGSGKSTLMNILSGHMLPTSGSIDLYHDTEKIPKEEIYRHISVCSPYIELIEEFSLSENISLFNSFKKFIRGMNSGDIASIIRMKTSGTKRIGQYSSGMKQRIKLAFALLADVPVVLLDEPCTNLDKEGIDWYREMVSMYAEKRLIIVSSNSKDHEYDFCSQHLSITDFK
jgi:ABC-type multidrug transport system ATPase subunit